LTGFRLGILQRAPDRACDDGVALSATIGAGPPHNSVRCEHEEIDALEVMGIRSVAYLASTRVLAGLLVVIPLYCVACLRFWAAKFGTTVLYGQSAGVYDHYFRTFLNPTDLMWSFLQCVVLAIVIMLVHTYTGTPRAAVRLASARRSDVRCARR